MTVEALALALNLFTPKQSKMFPHNILGRKGWISGLPFLQLLKSLDGKCVNE